MDIGVYAMNEIKNDEISNKISNKESFVLKDIDKKFYKEVVKTIEELLQSKSMKYRVKMQHREKAVGLLAIGGVALASLSVAAVPAALGLGALATTGVLGTSAQNLATWNPDYIILTSALGDTITLKFNK